MRPPRNRLRLLGLAFGVAGLLCGWSGVVLRAGGNTQFRDPGMPSQVIDKLWDDRMLPITWVLSENGLPGTAIDNPTIIAEMTAAFDTWEALPASKLDFEFGGELPIDSSGLGGPLGPGIDGRNLVTFTDPSLFFPPGVLAVAITASFSTDTVIDASNSDLDGDSVPDIPEGTYPAGAIFDGDIAFNSSEPWSVSGSNGTIDIRAVGMHEIGHFFGLSHSSIRDAVMFPFLDSDIAAARTPKLDDIAYASFFYPDEPTYSSTFGSISGAVINGFSSGPVLGAHVYAVDPQSGDSVVGAYSGDDGSYVIPGLSGSNYLVAIEPLDGDPLGLDPGRINQVIQFTFDTNFPEEFHDSAENSVETDPSAAVQVAVAAGADTPNIDLITNVVQVPGVNVILDPGLNLFAYPVEVPGGLGAFDLLQALGDDTEVNAIDRYNRTSGAFERALYVDGSPAGANFAIQRGEGYVVHMDAQKVINFQGDSDCPQLDLARGLNLIGIPCPPAGFTAFNLLHDIGARFEIDTLLRFDTATGSYETAGYDVTDTPIGVDFSVGNGIGYVANMHADKSGLQVPSPGSNFPPFLSGLSPGRGVPGTLVVILGDGFDPDVSKNTVTFDGIGASVVFATSSTLTVTVPQGAGTGLVRVTVGGLQSNGIEFTVENASTTENVSGDTPMVSGQTADGSLDIDGEQDRYTFTALAGSLVTVSATAVTPGVPDLVLLLEDPFGVVATSDDNGGNGADPRINNFELTTTGTHTIVVSNVPGSGLGAYQLGLTITNRSSAPQVSILGGNFQTGQNGSTLPAPLSVLITGATGAPVAGTAVTFVATEPTFGQASAGPGNAGTTVINTNSSGIVSVSTTLPGEDGSYTITVTVPGVSDSATFTINSTDLEVTFFDMNGDLQSGTVGQALASPFEIVIKDNLLNPVPGGLIAFQVVSGGGSISGGTPCGDGDAACFTTPASGSASTTLTLGTDISENQLVAAFVPGLMKPVLFEGLPLADDPASIHSNRSNFNRLTLGTSALSAMQIQVFDQYDNPVAGAQVDYTPSGGLIVNPGLGPGGVVFQDFLTNEDGLHVAMLSALSGFVDPTINEFGESVAPVYDVDATVVGGSSPGETFVVDVDMGPSQVTFSTQNDSAKIGQPLANPVRKKILRWQRNDTYEDLNGDDVDDDNGDFRDENYSSLSQVGVENVTVNLSVIREDGEDEAAHGLSPIVISDMVVTTDSSGVAQTDVTTMGDVGGVKRVIGRIDSIDVEWQFDDGSPLDMMTFTDENDFGEATNLIAIPIVISIDLTDNSSGIQFEQVLASLNTMPFFNGAMPPLVLPGFPEPMTVTVGGASLGGLNQGLVDDSAFTSIQIVYWPSVPKLIVGQNTVDLGAFKDNADNENAAEQLDFDYP